MVSSSHALYSKLSPGTATKVDKHETDLKVEERKHKHRQHAAESCALAAGAFALHEKHEAKKHPENRHTHKVREHVATAVAIGATSLALHEKHERKHCKDAMKKKHQKKG
ncbi:hypothetical protein KP509_36G050000 [Ceratopteris richardii]|uniref:Uncharacterized protein n=1 Tax=Ceratopteris richardii TaxID=49495 RepID=A0A8T2QCA2_CERRI|nr:hypothetical protein KP509_36G049800 [Ceratopteris richardii]KAH7281479.1 hypothetical protein KP509_36G049900 [Ceratopteris richardii]KAH7281480.1 hypothetical protein KP509_36G050000 [Ceratopteris richardii]